MSQYIIDINSQIDELREKLAATRTTEGNLISKYLSELQDTADDDDLSRSNYVAFLTESLELLIENATMALELAKGYGDQFVQSKKEKPCKKTPVHRSRFCIKVTERTVGTVAYLFTNGGGEGWHCVLDNNKRVPFFYAGIQGDEMAFGLRLAACRIAADVLAVVQAHGSERFSYEVIR